MDQTMNLKELAGELAQNGISVSQQAPEEKSDVNYSQNNTVDVSVEGEMPITPEHVVTTNTTTEVSKIVTVGDTPVIIAPPTQVHTQQKIEMPQDPNLEHAKRSFEETLMDTPTPVAIGLSNDTLENPSVDNIPIRDTGKISDDEIAIVKQFAPNLTNEQLVNAGPGLYAKFLDYKKNLIIKEGFGPEDAVTAAIAYMKKNYESEIPESIADNTNNTPDATATVIIDKSKEDINDLGLTRDEHEKLEKVKKIRLVVVEDMDLNNITIERPVEEHKADYVKSLESSISNYHVPLPMFGDFVSFRGAQIVQMINVINYEDARIEEIINKKASLIYDKLVTSSILRKYDSNGKISMNYTEFINKFPYQDIDIALYGILCASNMEETSTSLTCETCSHTWDQKYNLKKLLQLDGVSDAFKQRIDSCIKYKSNDIELKKLHDTMKKARRYKSPFSGNIYDLSYPTVARATNLLKRIDQNDQVMTYDSAIALYLSKILVYNKNKNSYVEVSAEETDLLLDIMLSLCNEDMNMLANQIREDLFYTPTFSLKVVCPSCHKESTLPLSIENMIFLAAQDSMVEIAN